MQLFSLFCIAKMIFFLTVLLWAFQLQIVPERAKTLFNVDRKNAVNLDLDIARRPMPLVLYVVKIFLYLKKRRRS